jgi:hypothetical protein
VTKTRLYDVMDCILLCLSYFYFSMTYSKLIVSVTSVITMIYLSCPSILIACFLILIILSVVVEESLGSSFSLSLKSPDSTSNV